MIPAKDRILHRKCGRDYNNASEAVAMESGITPSEAYQLLELGAVYCNGTRLVPADFNVPCSQNSLLRIHLQPRRFKMPVSVHDVLHSLFEDYLIAIKPAGLPTHETLDNAKENLIACLSHEGRLWPAHRLDQMTMGLVALGRSPDFVRHFQRQQALGKVNKFYVTYTVLPISLGRHVHFTPYRSRPPRPMWLNEADGLQRCELEVLSSEQIAADTWQSRLRLITGRTHQIRAQLAALGRPLIGDRLYGSNRDAWLPSPLLAVGLEFVDRQGQMQRFVLQHPVP